MHAILLGVYIALILIRPMDWWEPILGWQMVTVGAVAVFFMGLPVLLGRLRFAWKTLPEIKVGVWLLIGTCLSWLSRFWFGGALMAFEDVGKVVFFFSLILILVHTKRDFNILLWTFLLCVVWLSIHSIMQHNLGAGFGGQKPIWRLRDPEQPEGVWQSVAFGTFEDPNDLCVILVIALPLFYVQFRILSNPITKVLSLVGFALAAYGAWCTNSRGGVIAVFGMLISYVVTRTKGIKRYITLAIGISSVMVLAPSRFSGGLAGKDRAVLWGDGLRMFKDNPLFGVGYQYFMEYSTEHLVAHNTFIHTLGETGLFGYLPLFSIFFLTVLQIRLLMKCKNLIPLNDFLLLSGLYSALIGYLTGLYFISREYQHILYVILGLAITATYVISEQYGLRDYVFGQQRKRLWQSIIWGLGSVVLMWVTVRIANIVG